MDTDGVFINIHSIIPSSGVNGPGSRMVVFFQGCSHNCPDCFNPDTHPFKDARLYLPEEIFKEHLQEDIKGITVSGGEPFHQAAGLFYLLKIAKEVYGLTTVVYTGFEYDKLTAIPQCRPGLGYIDVLIDGRFEKSKKEPTLLARGSTNQRFYFFTNRYKEGDFYMPAKAEIIIGRDGTITETGFSRVALTEPNENCKMQSVKRKA
ncbi:MAG: 4Fe-4S single cluster domain-containing protein [Nitrospirota bacterium]|jgi:anaerobic ribonucleoside-triphosphate reductase activating protein